MFTFSGIYGNTLIKEAMRKSIKNNKISHAYIIDSEDYISKNELSKTFAKLILCENKTRETDCCNLCKSCITFENLNHPDVIYVRPTKTKSVGIDKIRDEISATINIKPYKSKYKIYIIEDANKMTVQGQNAILKTIENPPSYGIFILLSDNFNMFLPTILSRCILYKMKLLTNKEMYSYISKNYNISENLLNLYASYSNGNLSLADKLIKNDEFCNIRDELINILISIKHSNLVDLLGKYDFFDRHRDNMEDIFNIMNIWYRDILIYKETKDSSFRYILEKDKKNAIIEEANYYTSSNLLKKIEAINIASSNLNKNGSFQMTTETMLLNLKEK